MNKNVNQNLIRAAVDREREKSTLSDIYKQKYRNLKGRVTKAKQRSTASPHEIHYTPEEYENLPKRTHEMPERWPDETFEEYYNRIRSGIV